MASRSQARSDSVAGVGGQDQGVVIVQANVTMNGTRLAGRETAARRKDKALSAERGRLHCVACAARVNEELVRRVGHVMCVRPLCA